MKKIIFMFVAIAFLSFSKQKEKIIPESVKVYNNQGNIGLMIETKTEKDGEKLKKELDARDMEFMEFSEFKLAVFDMANDKEMLNNININLYESENFYYVTEKNEDKTKSLEDIYGIFNNFAKKFQGEIENPKITYMAFRDPKMKVPYAMWNKAIIVDLWDCSSSHEVAHILFKIKNNAFNEGLAQSIQKEGNGTMKEQNVNINSKKYFAQNPNIDMSDIISNGANGLMIKYHLMGSFIYYNLYVAGKPVEFFDFMENLDFSDNYMNVENKYSYYVGKNLENEIVNWKTWLGQIDEKSEIYVNWN